MTLETRLGYVDIRDAMGKASSDRHLALFAFVVYGLIVFPKALGYVSIEQVFVPSTRPIEEFLESEWPPNQSIEEWFQNLQEIEWRAPWLIRSTVQGGSFSLGPMILEEIRRDTNQVGSNLELAIRNLFQPFPSKKYI
ncbi:hypothetical protein Goklo_006566 [Gossypium klotzschianum]|uniref:Uncharacterized protein n=1 Tax=Gossypium klotzschianum TaxID=34286 RepID=A0A7J8VI34_9ROSI|nr:hypothetical protein [Gossypium klotzschianum]